MGRWLLLLGGPLIWAGHFLAIYAVASVAVQLNGTASFMARIVILGLSAAAIAACIFVFFAARRQRRGEPLADFFRTIAGAGAVLALIAIVWQTLPALAPIEGTGLNGVS
jgi:hypothetical protein